LAAEGAGTGTARRILGQSDLIIIAGVVGIVLMLVIPLPEIILDVLIALNITIALLIMLTALSVQSTLQFSVFPSLLLLITLFRLALNVSSTRLILTDAEAGSIIESFGDFVVSGNFVVGLIVFAILAIIQFVVITSGASRVAEVAARFTLDAMPGKQLSIDADLNAGIITEDEARARRRDIEREADFYGAMDGASRFVRGDAIAAIIIILVNVVGGLSIGVLQQGREIGEAADTFISLTVGDGLVSQIPALLISTATGIIVTRAATDADMGADIVGQLLGSPRILMVVGFLAIVLGIIPGMPFFIFLILGSALLGIGYTMTRSEKEEAVVQQQIEDRAAQRPVIDAPEAVLGLLQVDPMELDIGYGLIPLVDVDAGGTVLERISAIRRQTALELGFVVPTIRIRDNLQLNPNTYVLKIRGVQVADGELFSDQFLAMDPGTAQEDIDGIPTTEPAFGLPALWIGRAERDRAEALGYTVVDSPSVLSTHLTEIIRRYSGELLGRQDVQKLLDNLREHQPAVVESVIPDILNLGQVHRVLQGLLEERVSIRDLPVILESLADYGRQSDDPASLIQRVRTALARSITEQYLAEDGAIHAFMLDPRLEEQVASAMRETPSGVLVALPPDTIETVLANIQSAIQQTVTAGGQPILLCAQQVRQGLRNMTHRRIPNLVVLAYTEIAPEATVTTEGVIRIDQ
jgi:flagellar biosynthesis protein FlhA